jgi:hypothetical protein
MTDLCCDPPARLGVGSFDGAAVDEQQLPAFLDSDVKSRSCAHDMR